MKKLFAILLAFCLVACSSKAPDTKPTNIQNSLDLLTNVWSQYKEEDKFSAMGGDTSEAHLTMDGPGTYDVSLVEELDAILGLPTDLASQIDDAASLIHMMNANTFTCGAFHVKDANALNDMTKTLKDHILERQWVCGFPDKLVIITVDQYIVSFFGEASIVETFKTTLTATYSSASIAYEENIA